MQNLNKWIAENVMGYRRVGKAEKLLYSYKEDGELYAEPEIKNNMLRCYTEDALPSYTTDLNLAFAAARKINLHATIDLSVCEVENIYAVDEYGSNPKELSRHEHPATAICLAIYKLTGKDWEESNEQ